MSDVNSRLRKSKVKPRGHEVSTRPQTGHRSSSWDTDLQDDSPHASYESLNSTTSFHGSRDGEKENY